MCCVWGFADFQDFVRFLAVCNSLNSVEFQDSGRRLRVCVCACVCVCSRAYVYLYVYVRGRTHATRVEDA